MGGNLSVENEWSQPNNFRTKEFFPGSNLNLNLNPNSMFRNIIAFQQQRD